MANPEGAFVPEDYNGKRFVPIEDVPSGEDNPEQALALKQEHEGLDDEEEDSAWIALVRKELQMMQQEGGGVLQDLELEHLSDDQFRGLREESMGDSFDELASGKERYNWLTKQEFNELKKRIGRAWFNPKGDRQSHGNRGRKPSSHKGGESIRYNQ